MTTEEADVVAFARVLATEVEDRALGDADGGEFSENAFVDLVSEHLVEIGVTDNPVTCHYTGQVGNAVLRLNGYAIPDDGDRVDLIVSIFAGSNSAPHVHAAEITKAATQATRAITAAQRDIHLQLEVASDAFAMMQRIAEILTAGTNQAKVLIVTDGLSAVRDLPSTSAGDIIVSYEVFDLRRLMRTMQSRQTREVIDIELAALGVPPIPCVSMPSGIEPYETYLALIPGETLYRMYDAYGPRILEFNVRAFLQATGKVNRGIRDTIRNEPGYFLAYNNGISLTADEVRVDDLGGGHAIVGFKGLQIVNGGQTTASIHRAKKRDRLDLSRVHVASKITRLPPESVELMVPQISRFANTQNVIQEADFSSNEPFHIALERLSKDVWAPGERSRWFYERSRGQYQTAMGIEGTTDARMRGFKERTPASQRISKTDVARFLNTWARLPHVVSAGVQKNFVAYMRRLRDSRGARWLPDEAFFKETIAQAILFIAAQRIVRAEGFPAYRINIATYLVAYLSHRTAGRLQLESIWREQRVSPALEGLLRSWSHEIDKAIQASAAGRNVTEWCKKEACWESIRQLSLPIAAELPGEWVGDAAPPPAGEQSDEDGHAAAVMCMKLTAEQWFSLHLWGSRTGNLAKWQTGIAHTLSSYASAGWDRTPTQKQAVHGVRIIEIAAKQGFIPGDPVDA